MRLLWGSKVLRSARPDELDELKERVRRLHSQAFGWDAPPARAREVSASDQVRQHIKSWIAEWDMMLLDPDYRADIVVDKVKLDLSEDDDLSREDEADSAEER